MDELTALFHRVDPYEGFDAEAIGLYKADDGTNISELPALMWELEPKLVVEVGSWRGTSAIYTARSLPEGSRLICVDTWLGSLDFLQDKDHERYSGLRMRHGYPGVYYQFLANIVISGVKDRIIPFAQTSTTAAMYFQTIGLRADVVYIDAAHEEKHVYDDIEAWWSVLRDGASVMCGDDYGMPGVKAAVHRFAQRSGLKVDVSNDRFWRYRR